jgi:hypothetical protein
MVTGGAAAVGWWEFDRRMVELPPWPTDRG